MEELIFKTLKSFGFRSLGKNTVKHPDMVEAFGVEGGSHYVEIYLEKWGYSVHLYGDGFMKGYYPSTVDITEEMDLKALRLLILSADKHFKELSN